MIVAVLFMGLLFGQTSIVKKMSKVKEFKVKWKDRPASTLGMSIF